MIRRPAARPLFEALKGDVNVCGRDAQLLRPRRRRGIEAMHASAWSQMLGSELSVCAVWKNEMCAQSMCGCRRR
jgi:hypothetical protein